MLADSARRRTNSRDSGCICAIRLAARSDRHPDFELTACGRVRARDGAVPRQPVREDHSVTDLLTADYSLSTNGSRNYGIPTFTVTASV